MANKTIRKSANLWGIVFSLLIVIGISTSMMLYWNSNVVNAGRTIDQKYNETYQNLTLAQNNLDDNVNAIETNFTSVTEASSIYQVAVNGFKGLGNLLKLPISFLNTARYTTEALSHSTDKVIPPKIKSLILIGIGAFIILLLVAVWRGKS